MTNKGPVYVLICYILWGVLPIFWKTLAAVDSLYVLAGRIVWSLVFISIIMLAQGKFAAIKAVLADKKELLRLAAAGVFVCINWGSYIIAVNGGRGVDASLAYYMNPILAILLGTMVFREKLTKLQWLSVAVTFTGLVVTIVRYRQIPWMALIIGGSFAIYGAIKKGVHVEPGVSIFYETLLLAPFALVFMGVSEAQGNGAVGVLSGAQWLLLPISGIVTTVPLLCYAKGIKTTPMTLSGILMYINPTLQLLVAVMLYHEEFTSTHAILFAFVWSGLVLYLIAGMRKNRQHKKEDAKCA